MPAHEALPVRLLDEEGGLPAQQVRPQDVLDGIEDARVAHQLVHPGEEKIELLAFAPSDGTALAGFEGFELGPVAGRLLRRHHADREMVAVVLVRTDLIARKDISHRRASLPEFRLPHEPRKELRAASS